ncbi:MAG: radical SAM protein [Eubacteriales bacterium]
MRCTGCYARANGGCGDKASGELDASDWRRIFREAADCGISFILLAGGEPLIRRDVLDIAAQTKDIIFPVFTNGTMINEDYINHFDINRHLIPVISIEGSDEMTDTRRGKGVSAKIWQVVEQLQSKGILYGVSVTVTRENMDAVTQASFVEGLRGRGCGLVFYVEYVPAQENTQHLVLTDADLSRLQSAIDGLRCDIENKSTIILSFPGDEEAMGGCLAAGRGFFHINASGGAEPCPFSPFSVMNLKQQSLLSALRSPFFAKVREISAAEAVNHKGGCTLFQHKDEVLQAVE